MLSKQIQQRLVEERQLLELELEHLRRVRDAGLDETVARMAVEARENQLARLNHIWDRQTARRAGRP